MYGYIPVSTMEKPVEKMKRVMWAIQRDLTREELPKDASLLVEALESIEPVMLYHVTIN